MIFFNSLNMLFSRSAKLKLIHDHKKKVGLAQNATDVFVNFIILRIFFNFTLQVS